MEIDSLCEKDWGTYMDYLASSAHSYGIRPFLEGRRDEETVKFLRGGIVICDWLSKAIEVGQKEKIKFDELVYSEMFVPLKEFQKDYKYLETISRKVSSIISTMLEGRVPSEEDVRLSRNFLDKVSEVYQSHKWKELSGLSGDGCF